MLYYLEGIAYVSMLLVTLVVFSTSMWASAIACARRRLGRKWVAIGTIAIVLVGLPVWSHVLQIIVPGEPWLAAWWWLAFTIGPVTGILVFSLVALAVGRAWPWSSAQHRLVATGAVVFGFLCLIVAYRATPDLRGLATAWAGCGIVRGTGEWASHRKQYRVLWRGSKSDWERALCGRRLDERIRASGRYRSPDASSAQRTPPTPPTAPTPPTPPARAP